MKNFITLTLLGVVTTGFFASGAWSLPDDPPGKIIFKDNKCGSCHSIKSQGIVKGGEDTKDKAAPDLSNAGTKHNAAWMSKYLLKKETLNDEKHLKKFKGSDEDLEVLTNWLATLKTK
jgi:cytochrome c2